MPVFPSTLPKLESARDFSASGANNVIRTTMDAGPAKVRRRSTAAPDQQRMGSRLYTLEDVVELNQFFANDLGHGSLAFDMEDPITQIERRYRFVSPPQYQGLGAGIFSVNVDLELLP